MSRLLTDVTTSSRCRDIYLVSQQLCLTALGSIMSRPHVFFFINSWLPDLEFLPRPAHLPSITLLLQLKFCRRDFDMNFHCCQGFTTSGPLILVRLSCCIASSASYISNVHPPSAPSTAKIPLSLEFPAA